MKGHHVNDETNTVQEYMQATGNLVSAALAALERQAGEHAQEAAIAAILAGWTTRTTTSVILNGRVSIVLDLIAPDGEAVNLGRIELDGDKATLN